jgi:hypothetical protein
MAQVERDEAEHLLTERTAQPNESEVPKAALTDPSAPPSWPIYR